MPLSARPIASFAVPCLLAASVAAAAPPGKPAAPSGAPHPSPALRQIEPFAGSWKCTETSAAAGHGAADVSFRWDLDGFWLTLTYREAKSATAPQPMAAVVHWGYDDAAKRLVATALDNRGNVGTLTSVGWQGDKLVWQGTAKLGGVPTTWRETFAKKSDGTIEHAIETVPPSLWQRVQSCTRAPGPKG